MAELARVLKDYESNYSIRFISYVGHEQGAYNEGSVYHLGQALGRGEKIKAGLVIDAVGWTGLGLADDGTTPLYGMTPWVNSDPETVRIADMMVDLAQTYTSEIGQFTVRPAVAGYSDNKSYWDRGLPAIGSVGGTPYQAPGYHMLGDYRGCGDTLEKVLFANVKKAAQVQIGALVTLDGEVPPPPIPGQLTVVAAVASSADAPADTGGNPPMRAFDGNAGSYWTIASDNFGYPDRWLQADLGAPKTVDGIRLDFGADPTRIATDFRIEVSDDPTFATHDDAAIVSGNTSAKLDLAVDPALTGRWVRLTITATTGTTYGSYGIAEMQIGGEAAPAADVRIALAATGVTASSQYTDMGNRAPATKAIDSRYDNFWHASSGTSLPQWLQVDLGSSRQVSRAVASYYGGYALMENGSQAEDFQVWVGDDPTFAPGSYTVAGNVVGSDSYVVQVPLLGSGGTPPAGRYVRYVVTNVKGTAFWDAILYEFELYGPDFTAIGDSYAVEASTTLTVPAPGVLGNDSADGGLTLTAESGLGCNPWGTQPSPRRLLHVHARRRLQRDRRLHVPGDKRSRRLHDRFGIDHRERDTAPLLPAERGLGDREFLTIPERRPTRRTRRWRHSTGIGPPSGTSPLRRRRYRAGFRLISAPSRPSARSQRSSAPNRAISPLTTRSGSATTRPWRPTRWPPT